MRFNDGSAYFFPVRPRRLRRPFPASIRSRWASICAIIEPGFGFDTDDFDFASSEGVFGFFVFVRLSFPFLKP